MLRERKESETTASYMYLLIGNFQKKGSKSLRDVGTRKEMERDYLMLLGSFSGAIKMFQISHI